MKRTINRALAGITGAAALLSACAGPAAPTEAILPAPNEPAQASPQEGNYQVEVSQKESPSYDKLANVTGTFSFSQDTLTPPDEVFNIFGTAMVGVCSTPSFALRQQDAGKTHYINVSGKVKQSYSVSLSELESRSQTQVMSCSCGGGGPVVNASITGIPLRDVLELGELEEANTITVKGSDGYGISIPLSYALDKEALIAYQMGDEPLPTGAQLWMPQTVAKYFTRDVVELELSYEQIPPVIATQPAERRAMVNILNDAKDCRLLVGDEISFEGYADDLDQAIAAVEFSMDGGETWTLCQTPGADAKRWVYWTFSTTFQEAGNYQLTVRAITEQGVVSPLSSTLAFTVSNPTA